MTVWLYFITRTQANTDKETAKRRNNKRRPPKKQRRPNSAQQPKPPQPKKSNRDNKRPRRRRKRQEPQHVQQHHPHAKFQPISSASDSPQNTVAASSQDSKQQAQTLSQPTSNKSIHQRRFTQAPTPTSHHRKPSGACLLYTSPSPRDGLLSRMPSSA